MADNIIRNDVIKLDFDIGNSLKEINKLKDDINELKKKLTGGIGDEAFEDLKDNAEESVKPIKNVKEQAEKLKTTLTDLGKKAAITAFNGLKKVAGVSFKALVASATAAAGAIGKIVYESVQASGEFEQLKGGMEKIFNEANTKGIMQDANKAYKDLGMSANQYLATINQTGANFASTMGDQKGYDTAKTGLKAISDYASGTGRNIDELSEKYSMITRASSSYQSIADQFSGMLPATSADFLAQAKAAGFLSKKYKKLTDVPIAEYQEAVTKMLEKGVKDMGLAGNTAAEATDTLTGSLGMTKAAWSNLLVALGTGKGLDDAFDNFMSSAEAFAEQLIPVVERALEGIGKIIEKLAPIIAKKLPDLAQKLLPPLIKAAIELTKGLVKALPSILKTIGSTVVDILTEQFAPLGKLGDFFAKHGKQIKSFATILVGLVGAIFAFKKVSGIVSIFSSLGGGKSEKGGGGKKGGLFGFITDLGKMKVKTVLKAMANITIILVTLLALTAIMLKIAPEIIKLGGGKELLEIVVVMGALGAVGAAMAKMADIVGKIKITSVLLGLANIAIMLVGMTALTAAFMFVAPKIAKLASGGQILKVVGVMALLGALGAALTIFAGLCGMIPIPVVLLGLANIALVLTGFTALVAAYGALSKVKGLKELLTSGGEMLSQLMGILGEMVGSLIGGIAEGVTNALPGIASNIAAFAENIKPVFTAFDGVNTENAGKALLTIGEFLLLMTANDILSFFTGGTDFEGVAKGLGTLAGEGTKKFLNFVSGFKEEAFIKAEKFFKALDGIGSLPNSGGIGQWFSGKNDFEGVAKGLGQLSVQNVKNFFNTALGIKEKAFTNAEKFFKALDGIGSLPNSGGVGQWFSGKNDFEGVAKGLGDLSGEKPKQFFEWVAKLGDKAFSNAVKMFETLSKVGEINNEGFLNKLGDLFGEDNALAEIGNALNGFWKSTKNFFTDIGNVKDASNFNKVWESVKKSESASNCDLTGLADAGTHIGNFATNAKPFLNVLIAYKDTTFAKIPQFTHIFTTVERAGKVADKDLSSLPEKGTQMSEFATNVKDFFTSASEMTQYLTAANELTTVLNSFFSAVKKINSVDLPEFKGGVETVFEGVVGTVENSITTMINLMSRMPEKMGTALKKNSHYLSDNVKSMWEDAVKASVTPVNKLLDGANFVLKEFGAEERIAKWTPYAKGTSGHKGGNALVNDGRGAELIQMPNGRTFIPNGRNVFLPNAPKGMKVLSAENTAKLLGRGSPTFRYAEGTGGIDVWSFVDNANGLIAELKKGLTYGNGFGGSAGKGMVNTVSGAMKPWLEKVFEEYGVKGLADYVASAGVEQWRTTVARALKMEGLYSLANVKRTLYQMQTESGGNPYAINLWDSNAKRGIPSKGLMQVIDPTFSAYARAGYNKNIYDPLSNILASVRYATSRYGSLAKAYRGVGYSGGIGEVTIPSTSGGLNLSYTPESTYSGANSVVNEHNSYSPTFNLTLNGTGNDRDTERKVKRWIKEAMEDMFASMDSKNRLIREV